ncbi:MAG TPA: hypothetical protein VLF79_01880 [Candidatus Saccharimonadales bacterium]|nr:hypothetical protein [Candidatus Saccharimonadales bacterium]
MTAPVITLAAIALIPVVAILILRINAALVFLSLCLGAVLVQFVANDANVFLAQHSIKVPQLADSGGNNFVKIVLLLLPVLLTAIFMIRTVNGKGKMALNLLPAAGVGLLGALLVVPLLPAGLSHNIIDSTLWHQARSAQDLIVAASAIVCLLVLWLQRPKTGGSKHNKH